ncbi:Hypothetical protein Rta_06845 [Ramlibacter tataouinensis TTB310]|uniref:Uncharacterized protein n=1 Tax=Ramlibacter tataouinensis (strain ATCC BAA-407 / DSM 14655 / LMG 21543 / TTB310) TaxID=365046 RepID=F5XX02_RAMTT|nr:Hypothetical protein Rta_06845 [Ramlibacter tataouinensis TTB310]
MNHGPGAAVLGMAARPARSRKLARKRGWLVGSRHPLFLSCAGQRLRGQRLRACWHRSASNSGFAPWCADRHRDLTPVAPYSVREDKSRLPPSPRRGAKRGGGRRGGSLPSNATFRTAVLHRPTAETRMDKMTRQRATRTRSGRSTPMPVFMP